MSEKSTSSNCKSDKIAYWNTDCGKWNDESVPVLPSLNEHISTNVYSVNSEDIDTSTIVELVILRWVISFERSLGSACEFTLFKVFTWSWTLSLLDLPILEIIHGDVLVKCSILRLLQRRVIGGCVKSRRWIWVGIYVTIVADWAFQVVPPCEFGVEEAEELVHIWTYCVDFNLGHKLHMEYQIIKLSVVLAPVLNFHWILVGVVRRIRIDQLSIESCCLDWDIRY